MSECYNKLKTCCTKGASAIKVDVYSLTIVVMLAPIYSSDIHAVFLSLGISTTFKLAPPSMS